MKLFQWHFGLYLIPLAFLLPMSNVQAAVNCTASMPTVDLGSITSTNADNTNITVNINYKCNSTYVNSRRLYVCLAVDGGSYDPTITLPRYMSQGTTTPNIPRLAFTMTLPNGTLLSTRNNANLKSEYKSVLHNIPGGGSINIDVPIKISLLPNNGNISATPGSYTNNFTGGNTALTTHVSPLGGDGSQLDCLKVDQGSIRFPFTVQATVIKECKITANPDILDLGSNPANKKNIAGNSTIGVTCTNNAPYNIGLAPATSDPLGTVNTGSGLLNGTGSNTDKVPYQLRSKDGADGKIWGNTATSTSLGNGVAGIGNGNNQNYPVYVTVPNADFKPDTYTDTVTIKVNY